MSKAAKKVLYTALLAILLLALLGCGQGEVTAAPLQTPAPTAVPTATVREAGEIAPLQARAVSSLLDSQGRGLDMTEVCRRVHFERDRTAKELFGNTYVAKKTNLSFIVYPQGFGHTNCYRAVYRLTDTQTQKECCFTVDVWDVCYDGETVTHGKSEAVLFDTLAEAQSTQVETLLGAAVTPLPGGGPVVLEGSGLDGNGCVRFPGLPVSHLAPDGRLWAPTMDPLTAAEVWSLTGNGTTTRGELVALAREEILNRHRDGTPFTPAEEGNLVLLEQVWDLLEN